MRRFLRIATVGQTLFRWNNKISTGCRITGICTPSPLCRGAAVEAMQSSPRAAPPPLSVEAPTPTDGCPNHHVEGPAEIASSNTLNWQPAVWKRWDVEAFKQAMTLNQLVIVRVAPTSNHPDVEQALLPEGFVPILFALDVASAADVVAYDWTAKRLGFTPVPGESYDIVALPNGRPMQCLPLHCSRLSRRFQLRTAVFEGALTLWRENPSMLLLFAADVLEKDFFRYAPRTGSRALMFGSLRDLMNDVVAPWLMSPRRQHPLSTEKESSKGESTTKVEDGQQREEALRLEREVEEEEASKIKHLTPHVARFYANLSPFFRTVQKVFNASKSESMTILLWKWSLQQYEQRLETKAKAVREELRHELNVLLAILKVVMAMAPHAFSQVAQSDRSTQALEMMCEPNNARVFLARELHTAACVPLVSSTEWLDFAMKTLHHVSEIVGSDESWSLNSEDHGAGNRAASNLMTTASQIALILELLATEKEVVAAARQFRQHFLAKLTKLCLEVVGPSTPTNALASVYKATTMWNLLIANPLCVATDEIVVDVLQESVLEDVLTCLLRYRSIAPLESDPLIPDDSADNGNGQPAQILSEGITTAAPHEWLIDESMFNRDHLKCGLHEVVMVDSGSEAAAPSKQRTTGLPPPKDWDNDRLLNFVPRPLTDVERKGDELAQPFGAALETHTLFQDFFDLPLDKLVPVTKMTMLALRTVAESREDLFGFADFACAALRSVSATRTCVVAVQIRFEECDSAEQAAEEEGEFVEMIHGLQAISSLAFQCRPFVVRFQHCDTDQSPHKHPGSVKNFRAVFGGAMWEKIGVSTSQRVAERQEAKARFVEKLQEVEQMHFAEKKKNEDAARAAWLNREESNGDGATAAVVSSSLPAPRVAKRGSRCFFVLVRPYVMVQTMFHDLDSLKLAFQHCN